MPKHIIPLGTHVSFRGDSHIYVVDSYQELLCCETPCKTLHDECYEEPYIKVRKESWIALPLSKLLHIFDASGIGRDATEEERCPH